MKENETDLLGLLTVVRESVENAIPEAVWVRSEIASISVRRNGHCYMDLVQSEDGEVLAQSRAIIWAGLFRQLSLFFSSVTGSELSVGQQVLLLVKANYNPIYGFSLIVEDIDPEYTLGDAQRKRMETLERLRKEGLLDAQKKLSLPALPYRLAVISAPDAAGYRDFERHLKDNEYGFRFSTTLYPATMQGAACAESVSGALAQVAESNVKYDAVLILRGGGGQLDLSCFDEYVMCAAIATHPYPVLTAIGHDQDTHLCDMVSYSYVKTPTALADWFIDIYAREDTRLNSLRQRLKNVRLTRLALMQGRLDVLRARLNAADPRRLLEKGYVLAVGGDGRLLSSVTGVCAGDKVTVFFRDGKLRTTVESVEI